VSEFTESILSDATMEAIQEWVVAGSGLAAGQVIWEDERGPRPPTGCYISITMTDPREVAQDMVRKITPPSLTFTADETTETFTSVGHGHATGAGPFQVSSSGTLPAGLLPTTDYWFIRLTDDTFRLAETAADALADTEITITTNGTGTLMLEPFWVIYEATGHRVAELQLQCFAGGAKWRDARPVARLANVLSSRVLPVRSALLRAAGVGFGLIGPVQSLKLDRSTVLEPRAVVTMSIHLVSVQREIGSWIQHVELTPTINSVVQPTILIDR